MLFTRVFIIVMSFAIVPVVMADIDPAVKNKIITGLGKWQPNLKYDNFIETPIAGLYSVQIVGGPAVYVTGDGKYFLSGDLEEIHPGKTENWRNKVYAPMRKKLIEAADPNEMIAFKPEGQTRAIMYVFTDIDCPYCVRLHREVPALNRMGVEVRYLAYPRAGMGSDSERKVTSIWCSDNRVDAMNRMKGGEDIGKISCDTTVIRDHMALVKKMGFTATPSIVLENGTLVSGYRRASQWQQILGL